MPLKIWKLHLLSYFENVECFSISINFVIAYPSKLLLWKARGRPCFSWNHMLCPTLTKLLLATQPQRLVDPWFFQVLKVQDLEPGFLHPSSELRTVARQKSRFSNFFIWGIFYHAFCLVLKIHTKVWIFVLILPDFPFLNMFITTYMICFHCWYSKKLQLQ